MTNWIAFLTAIVVISFFGLMGYISHTNTKDCRDSVEIRIRADSEFKCHKDAVLSHAPHGTDDVLVTCTCKR